MVDNENESSPEINTTLLGTVVSKAIAFSVDSQRVNTQGEALLALVNETLPTQSQRLSGVEASRLMLSVRLTLLSVRISQLGRGSN